MGLFSTEYKTYVSSTIYNLAGEIDLRPNVVPLILLGNILNPSKEGLANTMFRAQMGSPVTSQRRMFNWAAAGNYSVGMPDASIGASQIVPTAVAHAGLTTLLSLGANDSLMVTSAKIDDADPEYWAEDWVRVNYPLLTDEDWTSTYDRVFDEIVVQLPGDVEARVAAPADLLWGLDRSTGNMLLYMAYVVVSTDPDTGEVTENAPALYTYRMGSGTVALDALIVTATPATEFYPALPLRINNKSIEHVDYTAELATVTQAFRRLSGNNNKLADILATIEESESIDDIDYASIMFGVSLNTQDKASKAYIYKFLQNLISDQESTKQDFELYQTGKSSRNSSFLVYQRWLDANANLSSYHPQYGSTKPAEEYIGTSVPTASELRVTTPDISHDIRLNWQYISETQHAGNGRTFDGNLDRIAELGKMKVGDYWIHAATDLVIPGIDLANPIVGGDYSGVDKSSTSYEKIYIFHQHSKYQYSRLEIVGLTHKNYVYNSTAVTIKAKAALADEEESGFIIPLHSPTFRELGLTKGAQMSTSNSYLIFNSYKVVAIPWWQRGIFRILMIIAMIVMTILFPPAGIATAGGVLGTNLAVGSFIGISSASTAVVAGAIANSLAAMVLSSIITKAAVKAFGEKDGALIGALLSFFAMQFSTSFMSTGSMQLDLASIIHPDNLLNLTTTASNMYTQWLNGDTAEIQGQFAGVEDEYNKEVDIIKKRTEEILGMTNGYTAAILMEDTDEHFGESSETFLGRTLLTGSDIAEITQSVITNFAELSLKLPSAIR